MAKRATRFVRPLKKETKPPGLMDEETWWEKEKNSSSGEASRDLRYLHYLLDEETGLYGFRPGNPWRLYPQRWINRFVMIQDKRSGKLIPFELNEAQRILMAEILRMWRRKVPISVAILKARQQGISTFVAALLVWLCLTTPHTRGLLMGHKKDSASIIRGRVATMLSQLRRKNGKRWVIALNTNNRKEVEIADPVNSVIIIESAEAPDYRGDTIRFFHAIEPADWPNAKEKANAVMQIVPQAAGTYRIIEGTAKGDSGWFAETWKTAWRRKRDGSYEHGTSALFFPWFIHSNYRWSVVFGRALPKKLEKEIESTLSTEEQWLLRQTYLRRGVGKVNVDLDQLAWRRWCIRENCQGQIEHFHQEYPAAPEEAFLSSGMKLFPAAAIQMMREHYACEPQLRGDILDPEGERKMMRSLDDMEDFGLATEEAQPA